MFLQKKHFKIHFPQYIYCFSKRKGMDTQKAAKNRFSFFVLHVYI